MARCAVCGRKRQIDSRDQEWIWIFAPFAPFLILVGILTTADPTWFRAAEVLVGISLGMIPMLVLLDRKINGRCLVRPVWGDRCLGKD